MAAGVAAGVLWGLIAPGEHVFVAADGVYRVGDDSNNVFVATALLLMTSALAGVVCAAVAWSIRSVRGPAVGAGLVAGGVVGGWIAVQIGTVITSMRGDWPGFEAAERHVGEVLVVPAGAGTWTVLIGQPLAAAAVYLAAALLHPEPDLGRGDGTPGADFFGLRGRRAPVSSADAAPRTRR